MSQPISYQSIAAHAEYYSSRAMVGSFSLAYATTGAALGLVSLRKRVSRQLLTKVDRSLELFAKTIHACYLGGGASLAVLTLADGIQRTKLQDFAKAAQASKKGYNKYVVPVTAAGLAVGPTMRGFVLKSEKQTGIRNMPKPLMAHAIQGLKAVPTVGAVVGSQLIAQQIFESGLKKYRGDKENKPENIADMVGSVAFVSLLSAPALAAWNGLSINIPPRVAITELAKSPKKIFAIYVQEKGFLIGLVAGERLSKQAQAQYGQSKIIEYVIVMISGGMGSLAGHAGDTALTRWSKKIGSRPLPVRLEHLPRGALIKCITVAGYSGLFKLGKDILTIV